MKENLLSHIGWKYRKKIKGFSLIELNISMFINIIVLAIILNTFVLIIKNYSILNNYIKVENPFDDAILNLERLLTEDMIESIDVKESSKTNNGEINIRYRVSNDKEDTKEKRILYNKENKKLIIETYEGNIKVGVNTLMLDVYDYKILKKNNIYYVQISNNNYERIICI